MRLSLSIRLLDILVCAMEGIVSSTQISIITQNVTDTRILKKDCTQIKRKKCKKLFSCLQREVFILSCSQIIIFFPGQAQVPVWQI